MNVYNVLVLITSSILNPRVVSSCLYGFEDSSYALSEMGEVVFDLTASRLPSLHLCQGNDGQISSNQLTAKLDCDIAYGVSCQSTRVVLGSTRVAWKAHGSSGSSSSQLALSCVLPSSAAPLPSFPPYFKPLNLSVNTPRIEGATDLYSSLNWLNCATYSVSWFNVASLRCRLSDAKITLERISKRNEFSIAEV